MDECYVTYGQKLTNKLHELGINVDVEYIETREFLNSPDTQKITMLVLVNNITPVSIEKSFFLEKNDFTDEMKVTKFIEEKIEEIYQELINIL